jgi:lipoprotein-anchoring transpeptidase ErfK/SrfK
MLPTADRRLFIGTRGYYTVKKRESLRRVGARLGVEWRRLAKINNLDPKEQLKTGQVIAYDNRKIVPSALKDGIVVNIADRTLYFLSNGEVRSAYPVAVGKPPRPDEDENWGTPTGRFIITTKSRDPIWKVPQSIQDEMEQNGKEPIKEVPPGKDNPLGKYAMKTSLSGIVIHSTNTPSSVYSFASHGCIRVMPEHMEKLFPAVELRTPGIIVYQPVKLAVSQDGRVFLEVNRDVYDRYKGNLENEVRKLVARRKVEGKVDWNKVAALLKKKSGIPEEVTIHPVEVAPRKPAASGKQKTVSFSQDRASTSLPY